MKDRKTIGSVAWWYGSQIVTQVAVYEGESLANSLPTLEARAREGMGIVGSTTTISLSYCTPKFYSK